MPHPIRAIEGLYAITPDGADTGTLLTRVRRVLAGGGRLLQYRNKAAAPALRLDRARALRALTREYGATFVVNDDPELALAVEADGVHLGQGDVPLARARAVLGPDRIIGVSCYNQLPLAAAACSAGADYVAFGAFFSSSVKPDAVAADVNLLRQARATLDRPIVAIGGITPENGAALVEAGADALAVISALFDAPDIQAAARNFTELFTRNPHHDLT